MKTWFEFKFALRTLRKIPGYSAMCILLVTLSLCVGLVTVNLVYNIAIAPLDYKNSDRWFVTTLRGDNEASAFHIDSIQPAHFKFISQQQISFAEIGALNAKGTARISDGDLTTRISVAEVSPNIFAAAELKPFLGRSLQTSDGANYNTVLSYNLWQNFYASDPDIVGKQIQLNENPFTVVGVMENETAFGTQPDLWIGYDWSNLDSNESTDAGLAIIGILKPNVSPKQAERELAQLTTRFRQQFPDVYFYWEGVDIAIYPFKMFLMRENILVLAAMAIIAIIVQLLCILNITNLFVARIIERQHEFVIRNCMGSPTFRLFQQILTESFIICLLGLLFSLPILYFSIQGVNSYLLNLGSFRGFGVQSPSRWLLDFDLSSISIAAIMLSGIWIASGIWPALKLRRISRNNTLLNGSKRTTKPTSLKTTRTLVGFQFVSACFLLIVSGSLYLSVHDVLTRDYGIAVNNRYIVELELPADTYTNSTERLELIRTIESQLARKDNIDNAAIVSGIPYFAGRVSYSIPDNDGSSQEPGRAIIPTSTFSPRAFDVFGIDIIEGRNFYPEDAELRPPVVIVDAAFAKENWPGESAVGKAIRISPDQGGFAVSVVGVASKTLFGVYPAANTEITALYVPSYPSSYGFLQVVLASKAPLSNSEAFDSVRNTVSSIDHRIAVFASRGMQEHLDSSMALYNMVANIFVAIGLITVAIACIGIFAITSRSVNQQTHLIGIRRALGSSNSKIIFLYLKQACLLLLVGIVVGGGTAVLANNSLTVLFANLLSFTPEVSLVVILALASLIVIATVGPTRRALKVEPGEALHQI